MKKFFLLLLILAGHKILIFGQTPNFPFPYHVLYTVGTIKPNNQTQAQLDNEVTAFYDNWKAIYLKIGCGDTTQYYVEYINGGAICVSEGQGYGMVIVAYMAGYDPNAKKYFDGLYKWYKMHPSTINTTLMNWQQGTGCVSTGNDAATDGDLDIAYALLLADKQWGSGGNINYLQEALNLIAAIKQSERFAPINSLHLGDWANGDPQYEDDTRPSDFMYDHFRSFQNATSDAVWTNITDECYYLVNVIQTNYSPATGLLPDFIEDCDGSPHPAPPNFLEGPEDGYYYYNACRAPWHLGVDYLISGDIRAKNACDMINIWLQNNTSNNVNNIFSGFQLNGNNIAGNNYNDMAFIAPFAVSACVNASNQTWLNDLWTYIINEPIGNSDYYGNTIKMLCMIIMAGDYWVPQNVTSGISEHSLLSFEVFPNPFSTQTVIQTGNLLKNATLTVDNCFGQTVTQIKNISGQTITLHRDNLASGLYFINLTQDNQVIATKKIVITD